mmetsp:Transcript_21515/g.39459  ORF Transcript_21515/g.39459 Transcript_21515/m.39459 type:complete len:212 (-) Transcript_21515:170-805(-)
MDVLVVVRLWWKQCRTPHSNNWLFAKFHHHGKVASIVHSFNLAHFLRAFLHLRQIGNSRQKHREHEVHLLHPIHPSILGHCIANWHIGTTDDLKSRRVIAGYEYHVTLLLALESTKGREAATNIGEDSIKIACLQDLHQALGRLRNERCQVPWQSLLSAYLHKAFRIHCDKHFIDLILRQIAVLIAPFPVRAASGCKLQAEGLNRFTVVWR